LPKKAALDRAFLAVGFGNTSSERVKYRLKRAFGSIGSKSGYSEPFEILASQKVGRISDLHTEIAQIFGFFEPAIESPVFDMCGLGSAFQMSPTNVFVVFNEFAEFAHGEFGLRPARFLNLEVFRIFILGDMKP